MALLFCRVMARFPTVRVERAGPLWIQGEQVVINWIFEMTDAAGRTSRLDELTRQRWRGDKIVEERFYYDPGQARG